MEDMVGLHLFGRDYENRTVLVTGHSGFKGSWLSFWLNQMGAQVIGCALSPDTDPSHFDLLEDQCLSIIGDIRDASWFSQVMAEHKPEIVFHLAAQSLVRRSYREPVETFQTNIAGLINVLEACRQVDSVKAVVVITSDKCYEDQHLDRGYCESDKLGGYDPYSASKACAEIITGCYRSDFFSTRTSDGTYSALVASARSGNVIGGGDWSQDRLIPDMMRAAALRHKAVIRNPHHIRPWQHVLEPLSGYLMLGQGLLQGNGHYAQAWNFGPLKQTGLSVAEVARQVKRCWSATDYEFTTQTSSLHETSILKLDCRKANTDLGWEPIWDAHKSIVQTALWYEAYYEQGKLLTGLQLNDYVSEAKKKGAIWALC